MEQAMTNKEDTLKLTPYQGKCRAFGKFKCGKCNREWASAHTWANWWQKCFDCGSETYPFRQFKLKKRVTKATVEEASPEKKHQSSLCGKCQKLGHACSKRISETAGK